MVKPSIKLKKSKLTTKKIATIGLLSSISILLGITRLGFIQINVVGATIMHLPVIAAGILEGPLVGAIVGLIFGVFSMYQALSAPSIVATAFLNPLVSVVPRILIGIVSYYVFALLKKPLKKGSISVAAFIGSYTNTIGVIGAIYLLHPEVLGITKGQTMSEMGKILLASMGIGSIFEAILACLIVTPIVVAIQKIRKE